MARLATDLSARLWSGGSCTRWVTLRGFTNSSSVSSPSKLLRTRDTPIPNWSQRWSPSLASSVAAPSGQESPSSPSSTAACRHSTVYARPRSHARHTPPSRRVTEGDRYPPQRYKTPVTLRQPVIARSSKPAMRAACPHPTVRRQGDLDQRRIPAHRAHAYVLVDESDKPLHPIQDGLKLYLNSCSPFCSISPLPRKQQTKRSVRGSAISFSIKHQNLYSP
jgi:hypothetical protein